MMQKQNVIDNGLYALVAASAAAKAELKVVESLNDMSSQFGLALTSEDIHELVEYRQDTLKQTRRIEFGGGVLPLIINEFCDSPYINQDKYKQTLNTLQEIFYEFKNECMEQESLKDLVSDEDIIKYMKTEFNGYCGGELKELATTCLERFSAAIRNGKTVEEATKIANERKSHVENLSRYIGTDDEVNPDFNEEENELTEEVDEVKEGEDEDLEAMANAYLKDYYKDQKREEARQRWLAG